MDERTPAKLRTPAKRKRGKAGEQARAPMRTAKKEDAAAHAEPANWTEVPAAERGDAIVAAMGLGGVDYLFFNSGSEIMFMQEAVAKAAALRRPAPKLIMMTHE